MCDKRRLRSACAYAQSDQSLCLELEYHMTVKLLTEHHWGFLILKGGCTVSSESTLVKMPHCWKSHVTAQIQIFFSTFLIYIFSQTLTLITEYFSFSAADILSSEEQPEDEILPKEIEHETQAPLDTMEVSYRDTITIEKQEEELPEKELAPETKTKDVEKEIVIQADKGPEDTIVTQDETYKQLVEITPKEKTNIVQVEIPTDKTSVEKIDIELQPESFKVTEDETYKETIEMMPETKPEVIEIPLDERFTESVEVTPQTRPSVVEIDVPKPADQIDASFEELLEFDIQPEIMDVPEKERFTQSVDIVPKERPSSVEQIPHVMDEVKITLKETAEDEQQPEKADVPEETKYKETVEVTPKDKTSVVEMEIVQSSFKESLEVEKKPEDVSITEDQTYKEIIEIKPEQKPDVIELDISQVREDTELKFKEIIEVEKASDIEISEEEKYKETLEVAVKDKPSVVEIEITKTPKEVEETVEITTESKEKDVRITEVVEFETSPQVLETVEDEKHKVTLEIAPKETKPISEIEEVSEVSEVTPELKTPLRETDVSPKETPIVDVSLLTTEEETQSDVSKEEFTTIESVEQIPEEQSSVDEVEVSAPMQEVIQTFRETIELEQQPQVADEQVQKALQLSSETPSLVEIETSKPTEESLETVTMEHKPQQGDIVTEEEHVPSVDVTPKDTPKVDELEVSSVSEETKPIIEETLDHEKPIITDEDTVLSETAELLPKEETAVYEEEIPAPAEEIVELVRDTIESEDRLAHEESKFQERLDITTAAQRVAEAEVTLPEDADHLLESIESRQPESAVIVEEEKQKRKPKVAPKDAPKVDEIDIPLPDEEVQQVFDEVVDGEKQPETTEVEASILDIEIAPEKVSTILEAEISAPTDETVEEVRETLDVEKQIVEAVPEQLLRTQKIAEKTPTIVDIGDSLQTDELLMTVPDIDTVKQKPETQDTAEEIQNKHGLEIKPEETPKVEEIEVLVPSEDVKPLPTDIEVEKQPLSSEEVVSLDTVDLLPKEETVIGEYELPVETEEKPQPIVEVQPETADTSEEERHRQTKEIPEKALPEVDEIEESLPAESVQPTIEHLIEVTIKPDLSEVETPAELMEISPDEETVTTEVEISAPTDEVIEIEREMISVEKQPGKQTEDSFQESMLISPKTSQVAQVELDLSVQEEIKHVLKPDVSESAVIEEEQEKPVPQITAEIAPKVDELEILPGEEQHPISQVEISLDTAAVVAEQKDIPVTKITAVSTEKVEIIDTLEKYPEREETLESTLDISPKHKTTTEVEIPIVKEEKDHTVIERIEIQTQERDYEIPEEHTYQETLEISTKSPNTIQIDVPVPTEETIIVEEVEQPETFEITEEEKYSETIEITPKIPKAEEIQLEIPVDDTQVCEVSIPDEKKPEIAEITSEFAELSPDKESETTEVEVAAPVEEKIEVFRETMDIEKQVEETEEFQAQELTDITAKEPSAVEIKIPMPVEETHPLTELSVEVEKQPTVSGVVEESVEVLPESKSVSSDISDKFELELVPEKPDTDTVELIVSSEVPETADEEESILVETEAPVAESIEYVRETIKLTDKEAPADDLTAQDNITLEKGKPEDKGLKLDTLPEITTKFPQDGQIVEMEIYPDSIISESDQPISFTVDSEITPMMTPDSGKDTEDTSATVEISTKVSVEDQDLQQEITLDVEVQDKIDKFVEETIELAKKDIIASSQIEKESVEVPEETLYTEAIEIPAQEIDSGKQLPEMVTLEFASTEGDIPTDVSGVKTELILDKPQEIPALSAEEIEVEVTPEHVEIEQTKPQETTVDISKELEETSTEIPIQEMHTLSEDMPEDLKKVSIDIKPAEALPIKLLEQEIDIEGIPEVLEEFPATTETDWASKLPLKSEKLSAEAPEKGEEEQPSDVSPTFADLVTETDESLTDIAAQVIEQYAEEITKEILEAATLGEPFPTEVSGMDVDIESSLPTETPEDEAAEVTVKVMSDTEMVSLDTEKPSQVEQISEEITPEDTISETAVADVEAADIEEFKPTVIAKSSDEKSAEVKEIGIDIAMPENVDSIETEFPDQSTITEVTEPKTEETPIEKDKSPVVECDIRETPTVTDEGKPITVDETEILLKKTPEESTVEVDIIPEKPTVKEEIEIPAKKPTEETILAFDIQEKPVKPEEVSVDIPSEETPVTVEIDIMDKPIEEVQSERSVTTEEILLETVQETKPETVPSTFEIALEEKSDETSEVSVEIPYDKTDVIVTEESVVSEETEKPLTDVTEESTLDIHISEVSTVITDDSIVKPDEVKTKVSVEEKKPEEISPEATPTQKDVLEIVPVEQKPDVSTLEMEISKDQPTVTEQIEIQSKIPKQETSIEIDLKEKAIEPYEVPFVVPTEEKTVSVELDLEEKPVDKDKEITVKEIVLETEPEVQETKPTSIEIALAKKPEEVSVITVEVSDVEKDSEKPLAEETTLDFDIEETPSTVEKVAFVPVEGKEEISIETQAKPREVPLDTDISEIEVTKPVAEEEKPEEISPEVTPIQEEVLEIVPVGPKPDVSTLEMEISKDQPTVTEQIEIQSKMPKQETAIEIDLKEKPIEPYEVPFVVPTEEKTVSVELDLEEKPVDKDKEITVKEIVLETEPEVQETKPTSIEIALAKKPEEVSVITVEVSDVEKDSEKPLAEETTLDFDIEETPSTVEEVAFVPVEGKEEISIETQAKPREVPLDTDISEIEVTKPVAEEEKPEEISPEVTPIQEEVLEIVPVGPKPDVSTLEMEISKDQPTVTEQIEIQSKMPKQETAIEIDLKEKPIEPHEVSFVVPTEEKTVSVELDLEEKPVDKVITDKEITVKEIVLETEAEVQETKPTSIEIALAKKPEEESVITVEVLDVEKDSEKLLAEETTLDFDIEETPSTVEEVAFVPVEEKEEVPIETQAKPREVPLDTEVSEIEVTKSVAEEEKPEEISPEVTPIQKEVLEIVPVEPKPDVSTLEMDISKDQPTVMEQIEIQSKMPKQETSIEIDLKEKPIEPQVVSFDVPTEEKTVSVELDLEEKPVDKDKEITVKEIVLETEPDFQETKPTTIEIALAKKPEEESVITVEVLDVENDSEKTLAEETTLDFDIEETPSTVEEVAFVPVEGKEEVPIETQAKPKEVPLDTEVSEIEVTKPVAEEEKPEEIAPEVTPIQKEVLEIVPVGPKPDVSTLEMDISKGKPTVTEQIEIQSKMPKQETSIEIDLKEKPIEPHEVSFVVPTEEKTVSVDLELEEKPVDKDKEITVKEIVLETEPEVQETKPTSIEIALAKKPEEESVITVEVLDVEKDSEKPWAEETTLDFDIEETPSTVEEVAFVPGEGKEEISIETQAKPKEERVPLDTEVSEIEITKPASVPVEEVKEKSEETTLKIDISEKATEMEKTTVEIPVDLSEKPTEMEKTTVEIPIEQQPEEVTVRISEEEKLPVEETEARFTETIEFAPKFVKTLKDITIPEGDKIELVVEFQSYPESEVSWFIDDQPVTESPDFLIIIEREYSKLTIPDVFLEDEGEYKVVVENKLGSVTSICYLTVICEYNSLPRIFQCLSNTYISRFFPKSFFQGIRSESCYFKKYYLVSYIQKLSDA